MTYLAQENTSLPRGSRSLGFLHFQCCLTEGTKTFGSLQGVLCEQMLAELFTDGRQLSVCVVLVRGFACMRLVLKGTLRI